MTYPKKRFNSKKKKCSTVICNRPPSSLLNPKCRFSKTTQLISVELILVKAEGKKYFCRFFTHLKSASQAGYQQDPSPDPGCQRIHVPISQQVRWFHWRERQRKQRLHSSGGLPTCACQRPASLHVCCCFFLFWWETHLKRQQTFRLKRQNCQSLSRWVSQEQENSIHSEGKSLFAHLTCQHTLAFHTQPRPCMILWWMVLLSWITSASEIHF